MSKYTPGPWKHTGKSGDGKIQIVESVGNDSWKRCRAEIESDDCDYEMAIANTNLIAAAPDLVEALKATPCYCEDADDDGDAVTCGRCAALRKAGVE